MYETPFKYVWLTYLGVKFSKSHCNFYTCIYIYIYVYVYMYIHINTYLNISTLFISTDLGTSTSLEKTSTSKDHNSTSLVSEIPT